MEDTSEDNMEDFYSPLGDSLAVGVYHGISS
jgi:hypothetical protein